MRSSYLPNLPSAKHIISYPAKLDGFLLLIISRYPGRKGAIPIDFLQRTNWTWIYIQMGRVLWTNRDMLADALYAVNQYILHIFSSEFHIQGDYN